MTIIFFTQPHKNMKLYKNKNTIAGNNNYISMVWLGADFYNRSTH